MFGKNKSRDMVALLVDHLDKSLAAGERLGELSFTPRPIMAGMSADDILAEHARLREFLDGLRALEMTLAARVDKARSWAREMKARDGNLKLMASLFLTGTQALHDAMQEIGDPRYQDFNGGDQALFFLKSRGLVAEHVDTLDFVTRIGIGEAYMIVGRIQLGALLDLCATFIDTLDLHYKLFPRPEEAAAALAEDAMTPRSAAQLH
jgi:hypothetical protein